MCDISFVNQVHIINQNPRVTAINSCIEVDLTGQVCADSIGTRMYSGVSVCLSVSPSPPLDNIRVMVIVWRLGGNIIRTVLCWIVWHNVHSLQHTYMSSSCRSNRLGLSHWDPYAVHRGGCLSCIIVTWWSGSGWIQIWSRRPNGFLQFFWHCWFGHLACKNRPWTDL